MSKEKEKKPKKERSSVMAIVKKKKIQWDPSTSADVVAYRVYVAEESVELNYQSQRVEVVAPKTDLIIPDEFPGFPQVDTTYQIGVTSVDDAGNESNMEIVSAPFDFDAPSAPTNVEIVDL